MSAEPQVQLILEEHVEALKQRIQERTGRRIASLMLALIDGRLVVRGHTRSFYVKQLALAAIREVVAGPVDLGIQVAS